MTPADLDRYAAACEQFARMGAVREAEKNAVLAFRAARTLYPRRFRRIQNAESK